MVLKIGKARHPAKITMHMKITLKGMERKSFAYIFNLMNVRFKQFLGIYSLL